MPMPRADDGASRQRPDTRPKRRLAPAAIVIWIVVWQAGSMALDSALLLPSPLAVIARLGALLPQGAFWARIGFSLARILAGFTLGALLGGLGALAADRWRLAEELVAPIIALAKSVPVASITVLALIWLRAANLAVFVVLLVVLPVVYENALQGIRAADPARIEAAKLYRVPSARCMRFFVMPTLFPYLQSALALGLGTAWKAGVAAEVIGIPAGSLGEALYDAKVYFDTAELFAITLAIVLASALTTALLRAALEAIRPLLCGCAGRAGAIEDDAAGSGRPAGAATPADPAPPLQICDITKKFGGRSVLPGISCTALPGIPICLMAPSGAGKTTLLRIIAQLEQADGGHLIVGDACERLPLPPTSMMFQDNRLAEQASALANVRLPLARNSSEWAEAPALLEALGLAHRLRSPAGTCSGGEQRRIALARALLAPHDILLLDEPFAGLDDKTKAQAAALIREREQGAIVIVTTHDERDATLLDARTIRWQSVATRSIATCA